MWKIVAALTVWMVPAAPPPDIPARPYVSCLDGHIVAVLSDCPADTRPKPLLSNVPYGGAPAPRGGGGGGGLLGGLLGGIL